MRMQSTLCQVLPTNHAQSTLEFDVVIYELAVYLAQKQLSGLTMGA